MFPATRTSGVTASHRRALRVQVGEQDPEAKANVWLCRRTNRRAGSSGTGPAAITDLIR
jgi:hypothetical protein